MQWKHPYAVKTAFDNYETQCCGVINGRTKFSKRAEIKPMAKVRDSDDSHVHSREMHMTQAADIAKRLAERLGLNEVVAYIGMLMHDAGHPFGAHEGEQLLKIIGIMENAGFFHHNAKGVDVILSEDIINKMIKAIPEAQNDPELKAKLENDAWYFLDIVVGHDGEATLNDIDKQKQKEYSSIREAVLDKVSTSNRKNIYKCNVETLESNLAKPADVIAYLKSDMLDAFEQGIITKFSDEYLELIGELLFENDNEKLSKEQRIEQAKNMIETIKRDKLRETESDVYADVGQEVLNEVDIIIKELNENGIDTYSPQDDQETQEKINEIVSRNLERYKSSKLFDDESENHSIQSDIHKIIDCVQKRLKTRQSVVEEVMTKIQDKLIDDYCSNTESRFQEIYSRTDIDDDEKKKLMKESMGFSEKVTDIMYRPNGLKDINYKEYTQYTKKEYQTNALPKAVFKSIKQASNALVKMGLIRDKFYDKSILAMITDENVKKAMKVKETDEKKYDNYKKKVGINELKIIKGPKIFRKIKRYINKIPRKTMYRKKIYKGIYGFAQRQGERFARTCEDVYYAIPYTIMDLVKKAVDSHYEENEYLPEQEIEKVYEIREELAEKFGEFGEMAITTENLEKYTRDKIELERNNLEHHVATEIAIKYFGGMNDTRIKDVVIGMGNISRKVLNMQDRPAKGKNKAVQRLIDTINGVENRDESPKEFRKRIRGTHQVSPLQVIPKESKSSETQKELTL